MADAPNADMKATLVLGAFVAFSAVAFFRTADPAASQLWLIAMLGGLALLGGAIILWVVHEPPVRWPLGRARLATAIGGSLVLLPFLGMASVIGALTLIPGLLFLPAIWWRDNRDETEPHPGTSHPRPHAGLVERHA